MGQATFDKLKYLLLFLSISCYLKKNSIHNIETDSLSKTYRGGTLKKLLLRTTPRLKESGKARRKSPSAITEPKAFPAPFCTRTCARKASLTPPTPPSARLEIILKCGRSSYISGEALSRRSSRFEQNHRSHMPRYCGR